MAIDSVFPIDLDFGATERIRGYLHVYDLHACVTVSSWPSTLDVVQARTAMLIAVLDGRIKVPDAVAVAVDLDGSKPRVV